MRNRTFAGFEVEAGWGIQISLKPFLKRMIPEIGHGSIWLNAKAIPLADGGTEIRISSAVVIWQ